MYVIKTEKLDKLYWLKRKDLCRLTLTCGATVISAALAIAGGELCADSERPINCPVDCGSECFVEVRNDDSE